ncbi:MAG: glycerol-3-phosphate 1-O-acyltransferase PlsY [Sulfurospirillum sp.]|nr:glycerol-3-phosphate 1-O-acyltransferase PlsY [Sulfurospirillum sp.]
MEFLLNINIQFYIIAYLAGGIPFGVILAKKFADTNIMAYGSGSIGATNVLRVLSQSDPKLAKKLAIATVLLDAIKGILVLFIADFIFHLSDATLWMIALLSVIGHCYSPFLKLEGGKGVATAMGVMLYMLPLETLLAGAAWFIAGKLIKISSVSSLIGLFVLIASSFILHYEMPQIKTHAPILLIAFIIIYKHIPNIVRLFNAQEKPVV